MTFYSPEIFPHGRVLQQHWQLIAGECLALPAEEFQYWPETGLYNQGWDVYGLIFQKRWLMENCLFCPQTCHLLADIPGLVNGGFSRLAPDCHILPHTGYSDEVLRAHLTIRTNPQCGIRVGDQTAGWRESEWLIFNDRLEHEAWNFGDSDRIVLLLDFVKPGNLLLTG